MSDEANTEKQSPARDPHGIDHEREGRLVKVFVGLIAAGFVIVIILLSVAIYFDFTIEEEPIERPPSFPEEPWPGESGVPASHP